MAAARQLGTRALLLCACLVHFAGYFDKPLRYLFLDAMILTSPITGIIFIMLQRDPRWRDRPRDGSWWRGTHGRTYRRKLLRLAIPMYLFGGMSLFGILTFVAHLMRLV